MPLIPWKKQRKRGKHVRSFRIVRGIHCSGSQLASDSLCPLGPPSSQCPRSAIHHQRTYPRSNKFQTLSSYSPSRLTLSFGTTIYGLVSRLSLDSRASSHVQTGKSASQARRNGPRRHQHFMSTSKVQRLQWPSICNPRRFGSYHHLTALSGLRTNSYFPRILSLRPTRLFSHHGGRVGDRVSLSRTEIQWLSPSLISCWKPFCVCMRAIQGSA